MTVMLSIARMNEDVRGNTGWSESCCRDGDYAGCPGVQLVKLGIPLSATGHSVWREILRIGGVARRKGYGDIEIGSGLRLGRSGKDDGGSPGRWRCWSRG